MQRKLLMYKKIQRAHHAFSQFVGQHISVAFEADPEEDIRQLNQRRNELERALTQYEENTQQQRQHYAQAKESLNLLNKLIPQVNILMDETLIDRVEELREELYSAEESMRYLQRHEKALATLEPIASILQSDPQEHEQLAQDYEHAKAEQQRYQQQAFLLVEVVQRRAHFSYSDAVEIVSENSDLNGKLRHRLEMAETERATARELYRQQQAQCAQFNQVLASLKSSLTLNLNCSENLSKRCVIQGSILMLAQKQELKSYVINVMLLSVLTVHELVNLSEISH